MCASAIQKQNNETIKVIKNKGWDVPWLTQQVIFSRTEEKISLNGIHILEKTLVPTNELFANLEAYIVKNKGEITIDTYVCSVRTLHSYQTNGYTFAYKATLTPVDIDFNGKKHYHSALFLVYYYDDNGDGIFETLEFDATKLRFSKYIEELYKTGDIKK